MTRADHVAEHIAAGDFARWARRSGIASAFGGRVASITRSARGMDISLLSDLLGMVSGRIRTDNIDNWVSDLSGIPSQEDRLKALEREQKRLNPKWKPGDPIVI